VGKNSKIEWTDATWSPIRGRRRDTGKWGYHCERISPGCQNCYACRMNGRCLPAWGTGLDYTVPDRDLVEIYLDEAELEKPLRWNRPRRVFVESMSDLFGEWVPDEMIDRVFAVMALAPQHTFQLLTKRADRMRRYIVQTKARLSYFPPTIGRQDAIREEIKRLNIELCKEQAILAVSGSWEAGALPLPNVWLGVSVEDQQHADERVPLLLQTPAALRFISAEPLLGPVNLRNLGVDMSTPIAACVARRRERGEVVTEESIANYPPTMGLDCLTGATVSGERMSSIDWVICSGESGPGARPMHPDWARSIRDQCEVADVPFFFKQQGEWQFGSSLKRAQDRVLLNDGTLLKSDAEDASSEQRNNWPEYQPHMVARVGKKAAGRLLDGREWNEFPRLPYGPQSPEVDRG
jgi:protein gp37